MHVYVVMQGEQSEGGSILYVADSLALARKYAEKYTAGEASEYRAWDKSKTEKDMWTAGCDWLSIERWNVATKKVSVVTKNVV